MIGEAKASGNLGNTLKVLQKFDEAIACCLRHLEISRQLSDRVHINSIGGEGVWCLTVKLVLKSYLWDKEKVAI
jgi:hypothetical protein